MVPTRQEDGISKPASALFTLIIFSVSSDRIKDKCGVNSPVRLVSLSQLKTPSKDVSRGGGGREGCGAGGFGWQFSVTWAGDSPCVSSVICRVRAMTLSSLIR